MIIKRKECAVMNNFYYCCAYYYASQIAKTAGTVLAVLACMLVVHKLVSWALWVLSM